MELDESQGPSATKTRKHEKQWRFVLSWLIGAAAHLARRPYSLRSATAGSMRAARHAGAAVATTAVRMDTTATDANVFGSSGRTPNRTPLISRPRTAANARPTTIPAP